MAAERRLLEGVEGGGPYAQRHSPHLWLELVAVGGPWASPRLEDCHAMWMAFTKAVGWTHGGERGRVATSGCFFFLPRSTLLFHSGRSSPNSARGRGGDGRGKGLPNNEAH
jgi:hypothetical protein